MMTSVEVVAVSVTIATEAVETSGQVERNALVERNTLVEMSTLVEAGTVTVTNALVVAHAMMLDVIETQLVLTIVTGERTLFAQSLQAGRTVRLRGLLPVDREVLLHEMTVRFDFCRLETQEIVTLGVTVTLAARSTITTSTLSRRPWPPT